MEAGDPRTLPPFPPRATQRAAVEMLLTLFPTVVAGRTAAYVSTAITSGRRLIAWRAVQNGREGPVPDTAQADYRQAVVEPNLMAARAVVAELRHRFSGRVVIDPTALDDLPGWQQADYHALWAAVIERFVAVVIFADGWQYSNGCAYEFYTALASGARSLDQRLEPLDQLQGLDMIQRAITELHDHDLPADFLESVATHLTQVQLQRAPCG